MYICHSAVDYQGEQHVWIKYSFLVLCACGCHVTDITLHLRLIFLYYFTTIQSKQQRYKVAENRWGMQNEVISKCDISTLARKCVRWIIFCICSQILKLLSCSGITRFPDNSFLWYMFIIMCTEESVGGKKLGSEWSELCEIP